MVGISMVALLGIAAVIIIIIGLALFFLKR